ncbi:MAG TPA: hypothetical protein VKV02_00230, partial [Acidobacteriaceae bacterium]|nr:hypothetical protein [Acidobacteriaceae bacterium]
MSSSFTHTEAGVRGLATALHVRGEREEAHHFLRRAHALTQLTKSTRQRRRIRALARPLEF